MNREDIYHSFIQDMHSGFAMFEVNQNADSQNFIFIDANKKFLEYFDLTTSDVINKNIKELNDKFFLSLESFLRRILQIGVPAVYEVYSERTDRVFELNAYPYNSAFIALNILNISKRKKLEKAYLESEENYKILADKAPISIMTFDKNGIINFVNESFLSNFGSAKYDISYFLGKRFSDLNICQRENCREIEKVLSNKLVELSDVCLNLDDHLNDYFCNIRAVPLKRANDLRGGILIIEDINERKAVESQLAKLNSEQELLLDNVDFLIWFMKSPKNFGLVNHAFADFFGVDKSFVGGKLLSDLLPNIESEDLADAFHKVWRGKFPQYFDKFIFNKFGNKRLLKIKVTPKLNAQMEVEYLVCSGLDITEQRRNDEEMKNLIVALKLSNKLTDERSGEIMELNRQLADSEAKLKESLAAKDKFFSIIAHDLISPFQGFMSLTKYLSEHITELENNDIQDLATALNKSAVNLHKLLENLLNWSRVQRGSIHYNPEFIDLKQAIDMNISISTPVANAKKIELVNLLQNTSIVYTDLNIINTIIRNLLSNAIKFTNYGGRIELGTLPIDETRTEFFVRDNGVGIEKSALDKVFLFDYHTSTLGTANETGTGLGLVLCRELAVKNRGGIRAESRIGSGTTFYVEIPLSAGD